MNISPFGGPAAQQGQEQTLRGGNLAHTVLPAEQRDARHLDRIGLRFPQQNITHLSVDQLAVILPDEMHVCFLACNGG